MTAQAEHVSWGWLNCPRSSFEILVQGVLHSSLTGMDDGWQAYELLLYLFFICQQLEQSNSVPDLLSSLYKLGNFGYHSPLIFKGVVRGAGLEVEKLALGG